MASVKSTLSDRIREEHAAILLSEDALLAVLYPGEVHDPAGYVVRAEKIHRVNATRAPYRLGSHILADSIHVGPPSADFG